MTRYFVTAVIVGSGPVQHVIKARSASEAKAIFSLKYPGRTIIHKYCVRARE